MRQVICQFVWTTSVQAWISDCIEISSDALLHDEVGYVPGCESTRCKCVQRLWISRGSIQKHEVVFLYGCVNCFGGKHDLRLWKNVFGRSYTWRRIIAKIYFLLYAIATKDCPDDCSRCPGHEVYKLSRSIQGTSVSCMVDYGDTVSGHYHGLRDGCYARFWKHVVFVCLKIVEKQLFYSEAWGGFHTRLCGSLRWFDPIEDCGPGIFGCFNTWGKMFARTCSA
jgi:hypothetical protein